MTMSISSSIDCVYDGMLKCSKRVERADCTHHHWHVTWCTDSECVWVLESCNDLPDLRTPVFCLIELVSL